MARGAQGSCACSQVPSDERIWGCLPKTGHVIHLPWHPWCPIYLSPKYLWMKKKFPRYLQQTMSVWNKLLLRFFSQHRVHLHPLSCTPLCGKIPEFWVWGKCGTEVSDSTGWETAWGHTVNAHSGFIIPGDLEGSNAFPVLSVAMSQSWANTPGQIRRSA